MPISILLCCGTKIKAHYQEASVANSVFGDISLFRNVVKIGFYENELSDEEDDEMADYIRDMMDGPWLELEEEEKERLNKFFAKAGEARYE